MTTKKLSDYVRFSLAQRVEHFVLILSFSLLGLTGLPQKYPLSPISRAVVDGLGGIETIRIIHRIAATVFLIEAIYHLVVIGYKLWVRREAASMVPTLKDGTDAIQAFQYNLGMRKDHPKMPRYNFTEKAEYWAMLWGLFVMAVTGFMLWNPIATTNVLPGDFIPAAKVAHGGEAVLAVLAIILWHFWHVHLRRFNKSMFTGKMDRHAMAEEHGEELEKIESGRVYTPPPPEVVKNRMTVYVPVAAVASLVMLAGVYWFVSFETSSVTTVPPVAVSDVFVQPTPTIAPPTPTPAPTTPPVAAQPIGIAWNTGVQALFKQKCSTCHGVIGGFKADTYENVMMAVEPGNPDNSPVYLSQVGGGHPGQFTEAELATIKTWIEDGAPEQGEGSEAAAADTWATLEGEFKAKCGTCHGTMGGYSVATYADTVKAVVPGNPGESSLVKVQQGEHPGKFSEDFLQRVISWIQAGAPEK